MPIQVLSEQTIAKIAAGEVVERPVSVVKELIENAIDAGASSIHVAISDGGRRLIRISDDGHGIAQEEVGLAFTRHATSKLRTIDDLITIGTLGFRGEALSSIGAVSRVTVTTRARGESFGIQLRVEGGRLLEESSVGAPVGTVISVENLFFNTPARLKFLKKQSTEKKHITLLITRYALAYPGIRFTLEQDGRELFRSSGSGQLADVMVRVVGLDNFKHMIEIDSVDAGRDDRPTVKVHGFASLPDLSRADRTHIALFINGRYIQDSNLTYAVIQAYHGLLQGGRYPVATLMIDIPPQEVDVNVHPTKAEVRFRNGKAVFSAVQRAVREVLISQARVREQRGLPRDVPDTTGPTWGELGGQMDLTLPIDDPGRFPEMATDARIQPPDADDPATAIPEGMGAPLKPRTLPMLRVVGQVGATYIVAEGPAGLYLIDQHAAHCRVIYDALAEANEVDVQEIDAATIDLTADETRLLEPRLAMLNACGIVLESFGPSTFVVRALPAEAAQIDAKALLGQLVDDLAADLRQDDEQFQDRVLSRISAHAAIKAGQILKTEDMQALIRQLERCPQPRTDPTGKPTLLHMSGEQLARQFGH